MQILEILGLAVMKYILLLLLNLLLTPTLAQKFKEESPYLVIRLMDLRLNEWKLDTLNKMERALDAELKYTDEKKGTACKSIFFEQEIDYPKQDARFLDLSIRGICIDDQGARHPIAKELITNAIIRRLDEVNRAVHAHVYRIGNVKIYKRNRNKLNLIIIPSSIGFIALLFVLTFFLRRMRNSQKRRHIITELEKKREASVKKAQTMPNIDPLANDKQRLLQMDSTVAGNVSNTMGSPKEFTNEQNTTPTRSTNPSTASDHRLYNRDYQGTAPAPNKDNNRTSQYNRDEDSTFSNQRSLKSSRERMHVPFESDSHFVPTHSQYSYEPQYPEMLSMHEHHPRVVVRTIRDDGNYQNYQTQSYEDPSKTFVSIPVQIEHSSPHQRFVPPPYHSDPYYPHVNS
ncbi:unnamed protein product [Adineta ricciae]|uniref:Uncharacterized protein n=1 Tax=Adineta ricciae TaxID=249248 RepID=A0A815KZH0_ADIRI|nr:unnamed protein product [Adineta ricciae]CAF1399468.1 unnamed protein product [Adineta ricciae]